MSKDKPDQRPICSAETPAPPGKRRYAYAQQWDRSWQHPDAIGRCISEDYDDWQYDCPHCKCSVIYEGPDA